MYYFIVNPHSKSGRGSNMWKKIEKQLKHMGVKYQAHLVQKPGEATRIAAKLTEDCNESRIIIAMGGDGTMNEVLNGLSFCNPVTLGYIPTGSGNDLARSLKFPKNPNRCLKKILNPKYHKQLDYGVLSYGDDEVAHRRFMVSAGIGLDAAVCHNLLYSKLKRVLNKIHLGKLNYIIIGLKQLMLAHPTKGYLILDGVQKVEFNHIYFVSAHIHPYEGGGFKFAPKAEPTDGKLDICVVHQSVKGKLLPILIGALLRRKSQNPGIRHYACREVEIYTDRVMPVHTDGESCFSQNGLQIQCIPKKIRMIV